VGSGEHRDRCNNRRGNLCYERRSFRVCLIFFAFIGFNTITMIAEEVKEPEKNFQFRDIDDILLHQYEPSEVEKKK
jgi:hypothetical protein